MPVRVSDWSLTANMVPLFDGNAYPPCVCTCTATQYCPPCIADAAKGHYPPRKKTSEDSPQKEVRRKSSTTREDTLQACQAWVQQHGKLPSSVDMQKISRKDPIYSALHVRWVYWLFGTIGELYHQCLDAEICTQGQHDAALRYKTQAVRASNKRRHRAGALVARRRVQTLEKK